MKFGIMFFSSTEETASVNKYSLLHTAARFADEHGFECLWTPERHFHEFGGLFPNPSVTSAALAMITRNIDLRAGSLISPLHNEIRIAEDLSLVDNLSNGRVGVSFGSGWNVDDFILAPQNYENRRNVMFNQIEEIKRLWAGQPVIRQNSLGKTVQVTISPKPIRQNLPIWITSSGNAATFADAGRKGFNILTHLVGKDLDALAAKIGTYRKARNESDYASTPGIVTLMMHTYLGADEAQVKAKARPALKTYLRSALALEHKAAAAGGAVSGGHKVDHSEITDARDAAELIELACDRYLATGSLIGTPSSCRLLLWQLEEIGVNEIACLVDFGLDDSDVLGSLDHLNELRRSFEEADTQTAQFAKQFSEQLEV